MFMSGLSESKQTHVHLRNVDPATLQIIITYAYTGNLAISDSTVEPLYETACFLQVSWRGRTAPQQERVPVFCSSTEITSFKFSEDMKTNATISHYFFYNPLVIIINT